MTLRHVAKSQVNGHRAPRSWDGAACSFATREVAAEVVVLHEGHQPGRHTRTVASYQLEVRKLRRPSPSPTTC